MKTYKLTLENAFTNEVVEVIGNFKTIKESLNALEVFANTHILLNNHLFYRLFDSNGKNYTNKIYS